MGTQLVLTEYDEEEKFGAVRCPPTTLQQKNLILALYVHYNGHGSSFFFRIRTQKSIDLDGGHALMDEMTYTPSTQGYFQKPSCTRCPDTPHPHR